MGAAAVRSFFVLPTLLCGSAATTGCDYMLPEGIELGQHRVAVQQGNVLTEESIRNLRFDMDTKQVLFLLGTPLVQDPFHPERWDYPLYEEATTADGVDRLDVLSLYFKDDKLKEIRRTVPIDPEAMRLEASGDLDVQSEWFEPGDAMVLEEDPGTEIPASDPPAPEPIEDEAAAEPGQADQD